MPARRLCVTVALAILSGLMAPGASPARGAGVHRYDDVLFVCLSIDPSGTPLNLRDAPRGHPVGTIPPRQRMYLLGRHLSRPRDGYVPVRLRRGGPADGWVWRSYLTCEISS